MSNGGHTFYLPSGNKVSISDDVFENYYQYFSGDQFKRFCNTMDASLYFPQIVQFSMVLRCFELGDVEFRTILLTCLCYGLGYTLMWYLLRLDKIPGLASICCTLGKYVFRFCLHYIVIAAVALFVFEDWRIIVYCAVSGWATGFVNTWVSARLSTVKYTDQVVFGIARRGSKESKKKTDRQPPSPLAIFTVFTIVFIVVTAIYVFSLPKIYNLPTADTPVQVQTMPTTQYKEVERPRNGHVFLQPKGEKNCTTRD